MRSFTNKKLENKKLLPHKLLVLLLLGYVTRLLWGFYGYEYIPNSLGGYDWVKVDYSSETKQKARNSKGLVSPDFNQVYHPIGKSIATDGKFNLNEKPTAYVAPGYPFFIAVVYKIFGENIAIIRVIQYLISIFTSIIVFRLLRECYGVKAGYLGFILACFQPFLIYQDSLLITECLFTFLLTLSVYALTLHNLRQSYRTAIVTGTLFGIATLVRPNTLLLLPLFLVIPIFLKLKKVKCGWSQKYWLITCCFLLTIAPWIIRNFIHFGKFIPISGIVYHFYEDPDGTKSEHDIDTGIKQFVYNKIEPFFNQPFEEIKITLVKAIKLLYKTNTGLLDKFAIIMQSFVIVLCLITIFTNKKQHEKNLVYSCLGIVVYYYITLVLVTKSAIFRYFLPIYPILTVLSTVGILKIICFCQKVKYFQKKVILFSTVHPINDTRIYIKEYNAIKDVVKDVKIVGVSVTDHYVGEKSLALKRAKNRFTRVLRSLLWAPLFVAVTRPKVFHFHDPELILTGVLAKTLKCTVIYDVHESYREAIISRKYVNKHVKVLIQLYLTCSEKIAYKTFDYIIAATPKIRTEILRDKVWTIRNFVDYQNDIGSIKNTKERSIDLIFVGNLSLERGAIQMMQLVNDLNDLKAVKLHFIGNFINPETEKLCKEHIGWKFVHHHGKCDRITTLKYLKQAKLGILLFDDSGNHKESEPNKLFEYMSCGCGVVASDNQYWKKQFLKEFNSVIVGRNLTKEDIYNVYTFLNEYERNSKLKDSISDYCKKNFNWSSEASKLKAIYNKIAL